MRLWKPAFDEMKFWLTLGVYGPATLGLLDQKIHPLLAILLEVPPGPTQIYS